MSEFLDEIKHVLKDFNDETRRIAVEYFEGKADFKDSQQFIELSANDYFINRLRQLFPSEKTSGAERDLVVKALARFGTYTSLSALLKIYEVSTEHQKKIKETLLAYGSRYIDEYSKIRADFNKNAAIVGAIDYLVESSGFYNELIEMLDYPSEKVVLYILKQFHKAPGEKLLPILKKLKNNANWMIRFNVAQVLKSMATQSACDLLLCMLADDNIKVRDDVKSHIINNYQRFSQKILDQIDFPESVQDYNYLQSILEIFEIFPDPSKMPQILKIISKFPEIISLKARSVLIKLLKESIAPEKGAPDHEGPAYNLIKYVFGELLSWHSEQAHRYINKIIDNFGIAYLGFLCCEFFNTADERAKQTIIKVFAERNFLLKDRNMLVDYIKTSNDSEKENFIKLALTSRGKDTIVAAFTKAFESIDHDHLIEVYHSFVNNDLNVKAFAPKYREEMKTWLPEVRLKSIEALGALRDAELLKIMPADWKTYQAEVKKMALDVIEKNYLNADGVEFLNFVYCNDEDIAMKEKALNLLSKINSVESTEIILKAFNSPRREVSEIASRILSEKGKERLITQIVHLPEDLKEQLASVLVKNDQNFIDDLERQISSTEPNIREQILKLLTHLARGERNKILSVLRRAVKNPDARIRADFTKIIGLIGGKEVIEMVVSLINDDNARVRANAIEVMAALNLKQISNLLLPMTSHVNNRVRANAIIALYRMGNPNVIVGLSEMLRSHDKWMRASATYALGEINSQKILPLLYTVLSDNDADVILNAIKVIKKIGDPESIKHVTKFLNHDNKAIKTAASATINHLRKESEKKG